MFLIPFFTGPNDGNLYGIRVWIQTDGSLRIQTTAQHLLMGYVTFRTT